MANDGPNADDDTWSGAAPVETEKARINRELIELLNELRIALPGVQVLFAFLLVLPFQQRWSTVTDVERAAYFLAVLATAAASILLIAPGPYHRIRFRDEDKFDLLRFGNRMLLSASVFLAIGIVSAFFLISSVVLENDVAGLLAGFAAVFVVVFWYGIPLYERRRDRQARQRSESS